MEHLGHLLDGQLVAGTSGESKPVYNPATGQQTGELAMANLAEVDAAIESSQRAFEEWSQTSLARRTKLMYSFRNLVEANAEEVARRLTAEHGKVTSDAMGEVARGIENIEYACGIAEMIKGGYNEQASSGVDVYSVRQPLGVVAGITPFNFPAMVPLWMIPNALATGNTFVLKPSERDPSAPMFIAELAQEAGFPPGVLNVVNGDKLAVDRLIEHPAIKAVSFVGSSPIAGGAKNHMIVLPDADINLAADAAVSAAYGSAGERCMAISVVVAVGEVADPLVEAIKSRTEKLTIGDGSDPASEMGPIITREARDRINDYVQQGIDSGATAVIDGRTASFDNDGFFTGVSLLDNVTTDMSVYQDEIFGPVLGVIRVASYQEGVDLIAKNRWGNGAAIFTRDGGAARAFQRDADAGMVGINVPIPVPVGYHSFGGWKDSLFGDTTMYGPEGVRFYTKAKVITSRWPDPSTSSVNLGFPTND